MAAKDEKLKAMWVGWTHDAMLRYSPPEVDDDGDLIGQHGGRRHRVRRRHARGVREPFEGGSKRRRKKKSRVEPDDDDDDDDDAED